jgi:2'-5' RNA ligase
MAFTIGIGVLFNQKTNNKLRQFELMLAEKSNNWSGLGQPPHITVKVPFEVKDIDAVETVANFMTELAQNTKSFNITLRGFNNFGDKVLYAAIENTTELLKLSEALLEQLTQPGNAREYERGRTVFHSTLAMNLSESEYRICRKALQDTSLEIDTEVVGLGLFLGLDELQHWAVISEAPFRYAPQLR